MKQVLVVSLLVAATTVAASAQRRGGGGGMGRMMEPPPDPRAQEVVVTVVPKHDQSAAPVAQADVTVKQGGNEDEIQAWKPITAAIPVDLAIIIDEDTKDINIQLADLKTFVQQLPPNVRVGLGYMSAGTIQFAQSQFTTDRNLILQKLRPPTGAADSSPAPYTSVQFLMQHWRPRPGQVHEMLLISDGVEHVGGNNVNNVALQKAVAEAVANHVVVYSILVTGAPSQQAASTTDNTGNGADGYGTGGNQAEFGAPLGASRTTTMTANMQTSEVTNGSTNLNELTEATGGVTYAEGSGTPPRFTPFLDDLTQRLQHQYVVSFEAAKKNEKGLNEIKIEVKAPDVNVTAPKQIFINK